MVAAPKHQRPASESRQTVEANFEWRGLYQQADMASDLHHTPLFAVAKAHQGYVYLAGWRQPSSQPQFLIVVLGPAPQHPINRGFDQECVEQMRLPDRTGPQMEKRSDRSSRMQVAYS